MKPLTSSHRSWNSPQGGLSVRPFTAFALISVFFILLVIIPDSHGFSAQGQKIYYTVQTDSFKHVRNAATALAGYQKKGFDAFCKYQRVADKGYWFRVYVGRFETNAQARDMAQRLIAETGASDGFVQKVVEPENPYSLHVGSYHLKAQAEEEIRQTSKYLLEPFCQEAYVSGQRWFRVYVGCFADEKDARNAGLKLREQRLISYFKPFRVDRDISDAENGQVLTDRLTRSTVSADRGEQTAQSDNEPLMKVEKNDPSRPPGMQGPDVKIAGMQPPVSSGKSNGGTSTHHSNRQAESGKNVPNFGPFLAAVKKAKRLMAERRPADAYALLAPLEVDLAGNMNYDYLLAISALDSGDPARATLVFERILAARPQFAGARLDMARAYYALGNYEQAKTELETVLEMDPPPQAKAVSEQYLAAIGRAVEAKNKRLSGYVETRLGYDSNVNNSTDQNQVYVPALAVDMALSPTNVKSDDTYGALSGGVSYQHTMNDQLTSYVGLDGSLRRNSSESAFDLDDLAVRGGLRFKEDGDNYRLGLRAGRSWLDGNKYRNTVGLEGDWRRLINEHNQLALFGQYSLNRYPDNKISDADQFLGGFSWLHALGTSYKPILFTSAYMGGEEDKHNRADGGKIFCGLRIGGQAELAEQLYLFANAGGMFADYNKQNVSFLQTREDLQYNYRFGLQWKPKENWTITPQFEYMENDSNIDIYEYDRTDVSLIFRRDFN